MSNKIIIIYRKGPNKPNFYHFDVFVSYVIINEISLLAVYFTIFTTKYLNFHVFMVLIFLCQIHNLFYESFSSLPKYMIERKDILHLYLINVVTHREEWFLRFLSIYQVRIGIQMGTWILVYNGKHGYTFKFSIW